MKVVLWSVIANLCLLSPWQSVFAQSQVDEQISSECQFRAQQLRTDTIATGEHQPTLQTLLEEQVEAMCQLNNQQPRTDDGAIATDDNPSPEYFTIPSLWWQERQVGEAINDRLIDGWSAYGSTNNEDPPPHVDVVVNNQIWPILNYLERYSLIAQFGESAKDYGYQLRIFAGNRLVGLQVCDFTEVTITADDESSTPACIVDLNYFGQGAIRGGRPR